MSGKVALGSLIVLALVGCTHSTRHQEPGPLELGRYVCAPQVHHSPCTADVRRGKDYWYVLPTHCGVNDAYFAGRLWVTRPRLMSTPGNPPRWIENPHQTGAMRLVAPDRAEFRARGHTIVFRPAASGFRSGPCD